MGRINLYNCTDEELVSFAQKGNSEAKEIVVERNKNLVKSIAHSFFLVGGDEEDLLIEGMIGVSKAVDGFKQSNDSVNEQSRNDFNAYANRCIRNQIIIAIRRANAAKNAPLNYYISLTGLTSEDAGESRFVIDKVSDPETEFIDKENADELRKKIENALSKLENEILGMYLQGYSYQEIGNKIGKSTKAVENAVQRIRKKVKEIIV